MNNIRLLIYTILFSIICGFNANALSYTNGTDKVSVSVITNKNEAVIGENIYVLIKLRMLNGWHTYWENPGETGEKTIIEWSLPEGFTAETLKTSAPQVFTNDDIIQYGYSDTAYFLIKLSPQRVIIPYFSRYKFEAKISWLACKDECVPEKVKIKFSIPVAGKNNNQTPEWENELFSADKSFPIQTKWTGTFRLFDNDLMLVNIDAGNSVLPKLNKDIKFIPYNENIINDTVPQIVGYDGDRKFSLIIPVDRQKISDELKGVILIGKKIYEIILLQNNDVKIFAELSQYKNVETQNSFIWILILAFTGGIILNLMPCILPILTLKAISLIQSVHNTKESRIEAIMYFFGVVISFMIIATILLLLRIKGEKIGWGFQMQSPVFLMVMIVIFFIIFLMMLDLIKVRNPFNSVGRISFKHRRINSFFTGLFSVLIASPCTAPFMGVAIGYTISQPLEVFYPVFFALSIGYALPFTLIGFFPNFMKKIMPKPGKWMVILKKLFALPILLTCIWLGWVLYSQTNTTTENETNIGGVVWKIYNEKEIEKLVDKGEPVFIDFTAKWCVTCLLNKKAVLETAQFAEIVKDKNIHTYRADWTNHDEEIEKVLEKYGRNSIPLYIFYPQDANNYIILPQILTIGAIKENFK